MISDSQNLGTIILEEIRRFLQELDGNRSPHLFPDKPRILFLLSQSIPDEIINSTDFTSLIRQYPSILLRSRNYTSSPPPCFSSLSEIPSSETADSLNDLLSHLKIIIVPHPSLSFMAQVTLGITPDLASQIFLQSLMISKPVFGILDETDRNTLISVPFIQNPATDENTPFSPRIRSALQSLQRQYVKILEDWGTIWIKSDRIFMSVKKIIEKDQDDLQNAPLPPASTKRFVITQEDIRERIQKGETHWVVPSNTIITSLAWETAEKHGFVLKLSS